MTCSSISSIISSIRAEEGGSEGAAVEERFVFVCVVTIVCICVCYRYLLGKCIIDLTPRHLMFALSK